MRILHVVQPPYGGAVAAMLLLARDQVERHDVGVVCHSAGSAGDAARGFGARVWTMPIDRSVRPRGDALHLVRLRRIVRNYRPDVVHLHSSKAGVLGRVAARLEGVPVVYSPHNFAFRAYEGGAIARGAFYLVERSLAPLTDCLHVVSQEEYDSAVKHRMAPRQRCGKIHNAIDIEPLLSLDPPSARTPLVIGTFARLYEQKRIDLLLDALAELRLRGVAFRGLVVGKGPLHGQLVAQAATLGLDGIVEIDATPHDAVTALQRIDIFALTSSQEVGPLTVMEAMAAERAVVATRVGVVPEILSDARSGLLVKPDDAAAFVNALRRLVEDPSLRRAVAAAGRETARQHFRPGIMSARMETLYATAVADRSR